MDKTFLQKAFEKILMLERNATFGCVTAKHGNGKPCLVVGLVHDDGGFTPLAEVLSKPAIDALEPEFGERYTRLNGKLNETRDIIEGPSPENMLEHPPLDILSDAAITDWFDSTR